MHPLAIQQDYGFWPSRQTSYRYQFPRRVYLLVAEGRIEPSSATPARLRVDAEHPQVFYLDIRDALRVVYREYPRIGADKHRQLIDTVGPSWRWQQTADITQIYLTLLTFDI